MNNLNTTYPRTATQAVLKQNARIRLGAWTPSFDFIYLFLTLLRFTGKVR